MRSQGRVNNELGKKTGLRVGGGVYKSKVQKLVKAPATEGIFSSPRHGERG